MTRTTNPRANNPQEGGHEPTGAITSDSLAAESISQGGGFSENDNAVAYSVRGSNSTFNTTDTSGATVLPPAQDNETRAEEDAMRLSADKKGPGGVKYPEGAGDPPFEGAHGDHGYAGGVGDKSSGYNTSTGGPHSGAGSTGGPSSTGTAGVSSSSGSSGQETQTPSSGATGGGRQAGDEASGDSSRPDSNTAPNYAGTVSGAIQREGQYKPKGKNLKEGDIPQTDTYTGNIGDDEDPGRLAEQDFSKRSAENTVSAGNLKYGGSGKESRTGGQYEALDTESAPDRNY